MEASKSTTPADLVDLYNSTKEAKGYLEQLRMENIWIERFLNENSVPSVRFQESVEYEVDVKKKLEFGEQAIFKFEKKIQKEQELNVEYMKDLNANIGNLEISIKDFLNMKNEFERNFAILESQVDLKSGQNKVTPVGFLMDLTKNISTNSASIRMKVGTMKGNFRSKKALIQKLEDLSSWLSPVDFDLAMFRKRNFQRSFDEIKDQYRELQEDERILNLKINSLRKPILEKKNQLKNVEAKTASCQERIAQLKVRDEVSQNAVKELESSIVDLQVMTKSYSAPNVTDYIEKLSELDKVKVQLKVIGRKIEITKVVHESLLKGHRQELK